MYSLHFIINREATQLTYLQLSTVDGLEQPSPFVYTPLHGVGGLFLPHIVDNLGIGKQMVSVTPQADPDPDFSTVKFPNPEEAGALDLAMELGDKENRDIIIANDPDADRFAAAQKIG
jgi:phosphoglucomutase